MRPEAQFLYIQNLFVWFDLLALPLGACMFEMKIKIFSLVRLTENGHTI